MASLINPFWSQYADTVGDGSGSIDCNVNGSVTPAYFYVRGRKDGLYINITRCLFFAEDTGVFDATDYGAIAGPLTNGVGLSLFDGRTNTDLLDGHPIKKNSDWAMVCYDFQHIGLGVGPEFVTARWTFARAGVNLIIPPDPNAYVRVAINDDLTGLSDHHFFFQGHLTPYGPGFDPAAILAGP